jgi:hypothetical protein
MMPVAAAAGASAAAGAAAAAAAVEAVVASMLPLPLVLTASVTTQRGSAASCRRKVWILLASMLWKPLQQQHSKQTTKKY